jgi:hypothetical protein
LLARVRPPRNTERDKIMDEGTEVDNSHSSRPTQKKVCHSQTRCRGAQR